jgi:translation initiation factor IF-2
MVDTKTPGDKTLSVPTKTLTLKPRVETGTVRQSFSHGRTKQVVVEKRGKRRVGGDAPAPETHAPEPVVAKPVAPVAKPQVPTRSAPPPAPPRSNSGVVLRTLTEDERSARASALADAKVRDVEERRLAEEEAKRRNSKEGIEQAEREAAEARRKAEEERHRQDEEAKRKAELEAKKRFGEAEAKAAAAAAPATARPAVPVARAPGIAADITDEDEGPRQIRRGPGGVARPATPPKTTAKPAPAKQRGRLTLVTALNADDVRERSIASFRRRTQRLKGHQSNEPKEKLIREVVIPEAINIQELANRMSERAVDVIRLLMKQGAMHKITDVIDADTAQLIAEELGHTVKRVAASDVEEGLFDVVDDSTDTEPRSPVVTVMGTSITARPRCSTRCATPMWCPAKPAASPSISAPIR